MKAIKFLDSLWFNGIMSILSVVMLVYQIMDKNQIMSKKYILIVIWIVLAFHFIKATYNKRKMVPVK